MSDRIGFIGLGYMGAPMCEQLLGAGFDVTAFDVRAEAVAAAVERGAAGAESAPACAAAAEVIVTMLPGPAEVEAVVLGAEGVLEAMAPGSLLIDMSSGSPAVARCLADAASRRGIAVLDAPVAAAERVSEGMLQIFVGGDAGDLERARSMLEVIGDRDEVVHVGPHGAGQVAKLLVNLQWFIHAVAAAEALTMGVRAGIDLRVLHRVFASSPARCSFMEHEVLEILQAGEYGRRFPLRLVAEELQLAHELAASTNVPAELSQATERIYERARRHLGDSAGEMGAVRLYEELTGTLLRFDGRAQPG